MSGNFKDYFEIRSSYTVTALLLWNEERDRENEDLALVKGRIEGRAMWVESVRRKNN